ncbi:hypothetical protein IKG07_00875 [Candidatus Saccharibacteria bacterium]|nr:hypothetical protein [Candidatus Saccharibacteria bacterium]
MGKRKGFTFIEVALFLAVTAALFIGIALGMQNSIFRQRYNDAVQNFFEFTRSIYSKVSNPQSPGEGNSKTAIYGKLIVFGEKHNLAGDIIDPELDGYPIFMYDVIGDASGSQEISSGTVSELLAALNANVIKKNYRTNGTIESAEPASPEKYEMRWQTELQDIGGAPFVGSILVVRHPRSGTINTLILEDTIIPVNYEVKQANEAYEAGGTYSSIDNLLKQYLTRTTDPKFKVAEVNFCVSPYGPGETGTTPRQEIRLLENARNASSVEMIETDGGDNLCF